MEIRSRGRIPILVGGTGFYIQALLYDIDFDPPGKRQTDGAASGENLAEGSIRRELEELAKKEGPEHLHKLLAQADRGIRRSHPLQQCEACDPGHWSTTARPARRYRSITQGAGKGIALQFSLLCTEHGPGRALPADRPRVDQMMERGPGGRGKRLKDMGCHQGMVSMQGLGYKEILDLPGRGSLTLEEAVYILKRDTRHFAKRQLTWFKRERDVTLAEP